MNDIDDQENELEDDYELPPERRRRRPLVIAALVTLALAVVLGSLFAARSLQGTQTATFTATTANVSLYFTTSPDWGTISLNGHPVKQSVIVGAMSPNQKLPPPLRLSDGAYQVEWNVPPFPPQRCTLNVPVEFDPQSCLRDHAATVEGMPNTWLITLSVALPDLAPSQRSGLIQAMQAHLDTWQASATVQPGEQYADLQAAHFIATATQPLKATEQFQLDANPNSNAPCIGVYFLLASPCQINIQNCHSFCPLPQMDFPQGASSAWYLFAPIRTLWNYTTLSGQVMARDQPDEADTSGFEYLALFGIRWHDSRWQITAQPPRGYGAYLAANPPCDGVESNLAQDSTYANAPALHLTLAWRYISGPNPADGCLAVAYPAPARNAALSPHAKLLASCLYRFGVLLAADRTAQRNWPDLPLVDSYEQQVVNQLKGLPTQ